MASASESEAEKVRGLFDSLENEFPVSTMSQDRWYLMTLAALTGAGQCHLAGDLYRHLTAQPQYQTPSARQSLVRRLRETLVKLVPILGAPKTIEAILSINAVERPEDKDYTFTREHWKSGQENHDRGVTWLQSVYQKNLEPTLSNFDSHKDFAWLSINITYGLFLSDHTILGPIETELVVLCGILIQNTPRESAWHLRGMRRIGATKDDVETIQHCVDMIADFCNIRLDKVPRAAEIEHEV